MFSGVKAKAGGFMNANVQEQAVEAYIQDTLGEAFYKKLSEEAFMRSGESGKKFAVEKFPALKGSGTFNICSGSVK